MKKIIANKKSGYLGWFIGALVAQFIFFFISIKYGDYSGDSSISHLTILITVVTIVADIFCLIRIGTKANKKWFDIIGLIGAYAPLAMILYYLYLIGIVMTAIIECSKHGCDM